MRKRSLLLSLAVLMLAPSFAVAQGAGEEQVGERLHWTTGIQYATEHWYRGLAQENQDYIFQPWVGLETEVVRHEDFTGLAVLHLFNSLHGGPTGYDGPNADAWYEADFYAGLAVEVDIFRFDLGYQVAFGPGQGFRFAEEVQLAATMDDTDYWGQEFNGLQPYIMLAFETDQGRDGRGLGGNEGSYLELGITPYVRGLSSETAQVDLSFPVTLGLNLGDYYETASGNDNDDTFGFLDLGVEASTPLSFVPAGFGRWTGYVGAHVILLGDSAAEISSTDFNVTDGDDVSVYVTMGLRLGDTPLRRRR